MLAEVAVVPSAPLLVPELAGPRAHDTDPVRDAVRATGGSLARAARRWIAVGAADAARASGEGCPNTGTFAGFGVDVPVILDPMRGTDIGDAATASSVMPLSMLVAGWLRGESSNPERTVAVEPFLMPPEATPDRCRAAGTALAARIAADSEPIGILVVGDGATALSPKAPGGGERDSAWRLQRRIDAALADGDGSALAGLDVAGCAAEGVGGRVAWQVLAGLAEQTSWTADVAYADAPFGVGYTVVSWRPAP